MLAGHERRSLYTGKIMATMCSTTQRLVKPTLLAAMPLFGPNALAQSPPDSQNLSKFMGRQITIIHPEMQDNLPGDGPPFLKGPASVCIEGPPSRQCYTAPTGFEKVSIRKQPYSNRSSVEK